MMSVPARRDGSDRSRPFALHLVSNAGKQGRYSLECVFLTRRPWNAISRNSCARECIEEMTSWCDCDHSDRRWLTVSEKEPVAHQE